MPEKNLVQVVARGRVDASELLETSRQMFSSALWNPGIDQICDFREVTGVVVSMEDMENLMDLEREFDDRIGPGRQALVVRNELHEMLCRLYGVMARVRRRPQTIKVFRSMTDAYAWLGLEP